MATLNTPEALGQQPIPTVYEVSDLKEVVIAWDTSKTGQSLAAGDFLKILPIPADCVVSNVRIAASASLGTTTLTVFTAADSAPTTAINTLISAATITSTTAFANATANVLTDQASKKNDRWLTLSTGVATANTQTIYIAVQFRAARYAY